MSKDDELTSWERDIIKGEEKALREERTKELPAIDVWDDGVLYIPADKNKGRTVNKDK